MSGDNVVSVPRDQVIGSPDLLDFLLNPANVGEPTYLDALNGSDGNAGHTPDRAYATFPTAYADTPGNKHNVLYYISGPSSINLSAAVDWSTSYTHLVGIAAATYVASRARIFQAAAAVDLSPLFTVSGNGNKFANIYTFQGVDDTGSLINWSITGDRNTFYRMHFAGGGHATQAINGGASLYLNGGAENLFEECTIGVDTISAATGMMGLLYPAAGGGPRNKFKNCLFTMHAGNQNAAFLELLGNGGIDRYQIFDNCWFTNLSPTAMTTAFVVAAGFDPNNKRFLLKKCVKVGAGKWDDSDQGAVFGDMDAVTGADLSGSMVELIS